jgi:hypothetical protein
MQHSIDAINARNAALMAGGAANDNALGEVVQPGYSCKLIEAGGEFTGKGGFFHEIAVYDDYGLQVAHFVGPFAQLNAKRFMTMLAIEQENAHASQAVIGKLIECGEAPHA